MDWHLIPHKECQSNPYSANDKTKYSPYLARKVLCSFSIRCSSAVNETALLLVTGSAVVVVAGALVLEALEG